jgi:hypothetical protein
VLERSYSIVSTKFGDIQVKCTTDLEGNQRCAPEYERCRRIAIEHRVPLKMVYESVVNAIHSMPALKSEKT